MKNLSDVMDEHLEEYTKEMKNFFKKRTAEHIERVQKNAKTIEEAFAFAARHAVFALNKKEDMGEFNLSIAEAELTVNVLNSIDSEARFTNILPKKIIGNYEGNKKCLADYWSWSVYKR